MILKLSLYRSLPEFIILRFTNVNENGSGCLALYVHVDIAEESDCVWDVGFFLD